MTTLPGRPVLGLKGIVQLEAYWMHACARLEDGQVWCWGDNRSGQLGREGRTPIDDAFQVAKFKAQHDALGIGLAAVLALDHGGDVTLECCELAGDRRDSG